MIQVTRRRRTPRTIALAILVLTAFAGAAGQGYAIVTVTRGDTMSGIAARYHVPTEAIVELNRLPTTRLRVGQMLEVPLGDVHGGPTDALNAVPPGFRVHTLVQGDTLSKVASLHGTTLDAVVGANPDLPSLDNLSAGTDLLIPPGEGLVVRLRAPEELPDVIARYGASPASVARANGLRTPFDVRPGMMLFLPGVAPTQALARLRSVRRVERPYIWPVRGRISSPFGPRNLGLGTAKFHAGVDIAVPFDTPVKAARAGTVTFAATAGNYGLLVKIGHADGTETRYAHNGNLLVRTGERVEQGQIIALAGSTGLSTGPHVHFEIREGGSAHDPLGHLP